MGAIEMKSEGPLSMAVWSNLTAMGWGCYLLVNVETTKELEEMKQARSVIERHLDKSRDTMSRKMMWDDWEAFFGYPGIRDMSGRITSFIMVVRGDGIDENPDVVDVLREYYEVEDVSSAFCEFAEQIRVARKRGPEVLSGVIDALQGRGGLPEEEEVVKEVVPYYEDEPDDTIVPEPLPGDDPSISVELWRERVRRYKELAGIYKERLSRRDGGEMADVNTRLNRMNRQIHYLATRDDIARGVSRRRLFVDMLRAIGWVVVISCGSSYLLNVVGL